MDSGEKTRLDRIEEKIDRMVEAIIALARAEEKIVSLDDATRIILKRMVAQDDRLRIIERDLSHAIDTTNTIRSVVWAITTAMIGAIVTAVFWFLGNMSIYSNVTGQ